MSLILALDGSGARTRETGVGFLDHMLDLLARHGRLDLDVVVSGDLETGGHHTVEDTGIVLGQALDAALGDRRGIHRYGEAIVPMDEARALCAIDISGRPFLLLGAAAAPRGDRRLRARAARGVPCARSPSNARCCTIHVEIQAPGNAHHMIEAAFKAFARGVAPRGRDRPDPRPRASRLSHQGRSVAPPVIGVVDYGMGNRRSVEKALEHVGARVLVSSDPRALRRVLLGSSSPGSARSPPRWRGCARSSLDSFLIERAAAGTPLLGICLGMHLAF